MLLSASSLVHTVACAFRSIAAFLLMQMLIMFGLRCVCLTVDLRRHAISGSFSEPKTQEIIVARGKVLELLRPDANGKIDIVLSWECFGIVRSLATFRLVGQ